MSERPTRSDLIRDVVAYALDVPLDQLGNFTISSAAGQRMVIHVTSGPYAGVIFYEQPSPNGSFPFKGLSIPVELEKHLGRKSKK